MRLIDADELIKQGYEIVVGGLQYGACNKSIDIDDIPTVYNIDKVVEELKDAIQNGAIKLESGNEKLFEIVKAGGKNG